MIVPAQLKSRTTIPLLTLILTLAFSLPTAFAQLKDGECIVPLDYSKFAAEIEDIGIPDPGEYALSAPLMQTSPVADGVITAGEYSNTCFYSFEDRENPGNPWPNLDNLEGGDEDLSVTMHLAHTDEYLFLGFDVNDEFLDLDEGANPFRNDGVELFMNPNKEIGDPWGPGKFQIVADAAGGGDLEFNNRFQNGGPEPVFEPDPAEGEYYSAGLPRDTEDGYTLEYQIPLGSLDTEGFEFGESPMKTGDYLLFNIALDDNDEPEDLGGQNGHHILWQVEGASSPFGGGEDIWVVPLELSPEVPGGDPGDYNTDGVLDDVDADLQSAEMKKPVADQDLATFDHNNDNVVDIMDRTFWVKDLRGTWIGDANLDNEFNSGDLVVVFAAGLYETGEMAGWAAGDWNGDMAFDSGDLVVAFADGGYELGPPVGAAVPEPSTLTLVSFLVAALFWFRRRR